MPNYNNYFPVGYSYLYPQQQFQQPLQQSAPITQPGVQQPSQSNNGLGGIIWVQGEAGAKSYLVAPNTTVQLWDSESQTIYLKSADASGMPSIKTLDYTIRESSTPTSLPLQNEPKIDMSMYVTKEELEQKLSSFNQSEPKQETTSRRRNLINE